MTSELEEMSNAQRDDIEFDLKDLIELDHDAISAYEAAIERVDNQEWAHQLEQFKGDHERHVEELSEFMRQVHGNPPERGHWTGPFKKALVNLGASAGDKGVLATLRQNEHQARHKYDHYVKKTEQSWYPKAFAEAFRRNAADEHRHYDWLVDTAGQNG